MAKSNEIGIYIREKRNLKGWSQEKLAEEVDVSLKTVSNWETGKSDIKPDNLFRLANALGVSVTELNDAKDTNELDSTSKEMLNNQIRELFEKYGGIQEITIKVEDRGVTALDVSIGSFGMSCFAIGLSIWAILPGLFQKILSLLVIAFGIWFLIKGKQIIRKIEDRIKQERETRDKQ